MYSVTRRSDDVLQPYGGYLKPSSFKKIKFNDGVLLNETENIYSTLIGLAVDYLTRFLTGEQREEAFKVSLAGAQRINEDKKAEKLLNGISGDDDKSIINACKLVGYDVCLRAGKSAYKPIEDIAPDSATIENIRSMVKRSISFFQTYGPVVEEGVTFPNAYTKLVSSGDADFLTADTLWDFKVSKHSPTSKQSLQLLMYYLMGIHSTNDNFDSIVKIGIFNPRLNIVYIKEINDISKDVITTVENDVIGYNGYDVKIIEQIMNKSNDEKEQGNQTVRNNEVETLTVTDLMKIMNCSRYMVMKMYTEQGLPLEKKGNRYIISSSSFSQWVFQRNQMIEEIRKRSKRNTQLVVGLTIGIVVILIIVLILLLFGNS